MRLVFGVSGIAAATALATAIMTPAAAVVTSGATNPGASGAGVAAAAPAAVQHVTRYVTLQPGQTAPPQSVVTQLPAPAPRTVVVTTTRQSGAPKP